MTKRKKEDDEREDTLDDPILDGLPTYRELIDMLQKEADKARKEGDIQGAEMIEHGFIEPLKKHPHPFTATIAYRYFILKQGDIEEDGKVCPI